MYEALEMLETLQNKAADAKHDKKPYYRLAYLTAREKVATSKRRFKSLIMRLLGDKDHKKVLDIVTKVEKSFRKNSRKR